MTHTVCEPCYDCKYTDCVAVCPVECFYQDDMMLYIDPVDCIDCEACVPECPVEAIFAEANVPAQWTSYTPLNAEKSAALKAAGDGHITEKAGRQGRAGVQEEVISEPRIGGQPDRRRRAADPWARVSRSSSRLGTPDPARHSDAPAARCAPISASSSAIRASSRCRRCQLVVHPQLLHPAARRPAAVGRQVPAASGTPTTGSPLLHWTRRQTELLQARSRRAGPLRHAGRQSAGRRRVVHEMIRDGRRPADRPADVSAVLRDDDRLGDRRAVPGAA